MATPRGRIFVAKQSFSFFEDGVPKTVVAGQLVRENHPIMEGREFFFKLDEGSILELPEKPEPPVTVTTTTTTTTTKT